MKGKKNNFSKNPVFIKKLFNSIASDYDKLNNIMSFGLHKYIKKDIINILFTLRPSHFTVLDLCSGTGDLAGILKTSYPQAEVTGVDFAENMLEIARKKHPQVKFLQADCTNLPFQNESFDFCVISFGLRNIENIEKALAEIYRVLKPDGTFINLDLGKPGRFFNIFLKPYMYLWISLMGKTFHGDETPYKYLAVSNETFPAPEELAELYKKAGFSNIKHKNYFFGQIASQISQKICQT